MPAQGLLIQVLARRQPELLDAVSNGIVVAIGCQVSMCRAHGRVRRRVSYIDRNQETSAMREPRRKSRWRNSSSQVFRPRLTSRRCAQSGVRPEPPAMLGFARATVGDGPKIFPTADRQPHQRTWHVRVEDQEFRNALRRDSGHRPCDRPQTGPIQVQTSAPRVVINGR